MQDEAEITPGGGELPWAPNEENALEQLALLQPLNPSCLIASRDNPPEMGQLAWRKDAFRVIWAFKSPLYNIGARGHFREQTESRCCLLIPAGLPVFFWQDGNVSYSSDIVIDADPYEANKMAPEKRRLTYLNSDEAGEFTAVALAFGLNDHLAKLALPIFTENTVLRIEGAAFGPALAMLEQLIQLKSGADELYASQLVKTFLMALVRAAGDSQQLVMTTIPREAAENPHITDVMRVVSERLSDPSLNLDTIAQEVHLNSSYLSGLFSQLMGKTLVRYIQEKRVLAARRLLITNPHLSIKEIMAQVGINTPQQMSRTFKKILGISPSKFRDDLESSTNH